MLEVKKVKGKWCVVSGRSILAKCKSQIQAAKMTRKDADVLEVVAGGYI